MNRQTYEKRDEQIDEQIGRWIDRIEMDGQTI